MAKPQVVIHAPSVLFAGEVHTIDVDVSVDGETKVEFIEARLLCDQGWSVGSGKSRVSHRVRYPEFVSQLMAAGVLPAATTTRFSMRFKLPLGTPPSHEVSPAWARTDLRIRISIPWRFDPKYRFAMVVRAHTPAHVDRTPFAIRSTPPTAAADKPRIELGLPATRLVAGETVHGTCAVFHLDDRKSREVELTLVPMMLLHGRGRPRERRGSTFGFSVELPAGSAGTGVPFQFRLPSNITPSFKTVTHELSWWLVAMSGSFFGGKVDVSVPIEILDASAAETTARLAAPPRLGDERIATLFAKFAARAGWQGGNPDDAPDDGDERLAGQFSIERTVGESRLRLAYAYRGEDGTFVVARIAHAALGLGLAVVPSSSLRHVFFADIEVDMAAWDRAHHVTARDGAQTIPMLREVVPALMRCGRLGSLVRWDDDAIVFERPMSTIEEAELAAMSDQLELVATAITAARAVITPPPGLTVELDAWHELARWLDAELVVGDLSIDGALDGQPVALGLEWDDPAARPARVRVALGDPEAAGAELRRIALSLPRPAADVLGDPAADKLVDLVTRWPADFVELDVTDGVASAAYALAETADAARVRELVQALRAVLSALSPATGPYR